MQGQDRQRPVAGIADEGLDVIGDVDNLLAAGVDRDLHGSHGGLLGVALTMRLRPIVRGGRMRMGM